MSLSLPQPLSSLLPSLPSSSSHPPLPPSPLPPIPSAPVFTTLISTRAGVLSALATLPEPAGNEGRRLAHDLLWGYVDHKVRRDVPPLVVVGKMGELEREMVKHNLSEFAGEAQEVRRQHSLPPSRAFPLVPRPNTSPARSRSTSTSAARRRHFAFPSDSDQPLEVLVLTQHGVLRGLASSRASEGEHEYARELLRGYVESKMRRGVPPLAVSAKLGMLEREMLRADMTQFATDVQQTRLLLCMPPSRIFRSSTTSSDPRSTSTSRSRRPPVFRAPSTNDGLAGAPPAYEARDPNPSEEEEREAVMRGRMGLLEVERGGEETEEGEEAGLGSVLPSFEEVVSGRVGSTRE